MKGRLRSTAGRPPGGAGGGLHCATLRDVSPDKQAYAPFLRAVHLFMCRSHLVNFGNILSSYVKIFLPINNWEKL